MKYVTRISLFENGERFPVLLYEDTFQPVILSLRYVIEERRDTRQVGTIEREVRVIKWLYEWTDSRGINLEDFLRAGKLFSAGELTGLCRYLRTLRNSKVVGAVGISAEILSPTTFNSYLNVVEAFLCWAAREFTPKNSPEHEISTAVENARDKIKWAFSTNKMGGRNAYKTGLTKEELTLLRKTIDPQSPDNPFKPTCRFRNKLIVELLLNAGIRRGELLKLKITHLPQGSKQTITVMRFPGDQFDPRRNEPQVKTLSREIPLPKSVAKMLWEYVEKHRIKGKHQFLFTSHQNGAPLSLSAVDYIFAQIVRKSLSQLKGRLHPHILRHTFNDNFVRHGKEIGWSDARIEKTQKYLNGWSENSAMPEHYTRLTIQMEAAEIMEKYQTSLYEDEK